MRMIDGPYLSAINCSILLLLLLLLLSNHRTVGFIPIEYQQLVIPKKGHKCPLYTFLCIQMCYTIRFSQLVSSTVYSAVWSIFYRFHSIPQHTLYQHVFSIGFVWFISFVGFLGPLKSKNALSVAKFIKELNIPEVSPSATAASLNDRNKYSVHRTAASDLFQIKVSW